MKRPAIWDSRSASYSEGAKDKVSLHTVCHVPASSAAGDPSTINVRFSSSLISCVETEEEEGKNICNTEQKENYLNLCDMTRKT